MALVAQVFCRETLTTTVLVLTVFLLFLELSKWWRRPPRYPPGPTPAGKHLHGSFGQLRKKFGDVFSFQMAWTPVVVLNGPVAVREALVQKSEDTSDRPPSPISNHLGFGPNAQGGIFARYGEAWKEQRRFSFTTMRNFRLGKFLAVRATLRWDGLPSVAYTGSSTVKGDCKVQEEIDRVIGLDQRPTMKDQVHMPFANAVIHEVQRFLDIIPLGIPHMASRDLEIQGFFIRKWESGWSGVCHQPGKDSIWDSPNLCVGCSPAGRRMCLGEPLAKMKLFLFFTNLLQDLNFVLPPGNPLPSDEASTTSLLTPQPFQVRAMPR
ncbi:cytochrome P450 2D14 [Trichosurus vulpecula]|uniref:cytochrome P450 2D14 n=1 Tax=Trichosurus vulpecula TaxID=9337 RepID=UPI00186B4D24|nr:cytochrome P450 2D14 [Trichosurus vulpecula]